MHATALRGPLRLQTLSVQFSSVVQRYARDRRRLGVLLAGIGGKGFEILRVFCRGFEISTRYLEPSGAFRPKVRIPALFFVPSGILSELEMCRTLNEYAEPSAAWKSQTNVQTV